MTAYASLACAAMTFGRSADSHRSHERGADEACAHAEAEATNHWVICRCFETNVLAKPRDLDALRPRRRLGQLA
jgi:hypothetical protein